MNLVLIDYFYLLRCWDRILIGGRDDLISLIRLFFFVCKLFLMRKWYEV